LPYITPSLLRLDRKLTLRINGFDNWQKPAAGNSLRSDRLTKPKAAALHFLLPAAVLTLTVLRSIHGNPVCRMHAARAARFNVRRKNC
jgi:hypothetical protein